jgi:hypothetical protein
MTLHPDFCHSIKAPERCKGLKTTTKCSLSPLDHYMLYSISVPEFAIPVSTAAFFRENNYQWRIIYVCARRLIFLDKTGGNILIATNKFMYIFIKIQKHERGEANQSRGASFSFRFIHMTKMTCK